MSALTNVWRQLVQRRLWPVAILLIAALAAVPLTLAKEPTAAPAPPAPAATGGKDELAVTPIVAKAGVEDRASRRRVLGAKKNPFAVASADDGVVGADQPTGTSDTTTGPGSGDATAPAGGTPDTTGGGGTAPSAPAPSGGSTPPAAPKPPTKTYALHELTVRFGDSEGGGARQSLKRLQPLPSAEEPVLIYMGLLNDGETAVFLVDHGVQAIGDGDCRPTPDTCETIRLRAGETEFLDVIDETGAVGAQYQLDLIKIHKGKTASVARARVSSKAGARLLKARVAADGPTSYRWDAAAGALERRDGRELRGTVADVTVGLP